MSAHTSCFNYGLEFEAQYKQDMDPRISKDRVKEWILRQACFQDVPGTTLQVQAPLDSLSTAEQNAYRILLHPSSSPPPMHPMLELVSAVVKATYHTKDSKLQLERARRQARTAVAHASTNLLKSPGTAPMPHQGTNT